MSEQERVTWVALGITVLISLWYFVRVLGMPAEARWRRPESA
jgi:hypothetical protein